MQIKINGQIAATLFSWAVTMGMLSLMYAKLGDLNASIERILQTQQQMTLEMREDMREWRQESREDMRELRRLTALLAHSQARKNTTAPVDASAIPAN